MNDNDLILYVDGKPVLCTTDITFTLPVDPETRCITGPSQTWTVTSDPNYYLLHRDKPIRIGRQRKAKKAFMYTRRTHQHTQKNFIKAVRWLYWIQSTSRKQW